MSLSDEKRLKKPLTLTLVAAGYLGAMVLHVAQIYLQGRSVYPHDVLLILFYPVAAYGIFKVRAWGWGLVIGHLIFLLGSNVILAIQENYFDNWLFIQTNLLLLFFLWYFLRKSVRSPFHNPALRWWERQHPRFGATFRVVVRTAAGEAAEAEGVNLSMGGCFVRLAHDQDVALKEPVELELHYDDFDAFRTKGRVSWVSGGSEMNPKGVGIAFSRPDRANRLILRAIIKVVEARWIKSAQGAPA